MGQSVDSTVCYGVCGSIKGTSNSKGVCLSENTRKRPETGNVRQHRSFIMPFSLDPEHLKAIEPLLPLFASAPKHAVGDVTSRRAAFERNSGFVDDALPAITDVEQSIFHAKATDGFDIPIYRYAKQGVKTSSTPVPAILYARGGGYILINGAGYSRALGGQVSSSGIQVFDIDYRVAPEAPYPVPVEDCYTALQWLHEHVEDFNIDPARIAVMGDSAGGGLMAGVALLARDRALSPPLAKQILIYPMLDDRNNIPLPSIEPFAVWNSVDNITGWTAYIGDKAGKDGVSPYAAPARADTVKELPPTYIDVGELDIFRDEIIAYGSRLLAADVSTELHVYPGVPHGFERMAQGISLSVQATQNRKRAMLSF